MNSFKRYFPVFSLTFILFVLLIAVTYVGNKSSDSLNSMKLVVKNNEAIEEITFWKNDADGKYYAFLPAYADLRHIYIKNESNRNY